jgi:hypothetical protein
MILYGPVRNAFDAIGYCHFWAQKVETFPDPDPASQSKGCEFATTGLRTLQDSILSLTSFILPLMRIRSVPDL